MSSHRSKIELCCENANRRFPFPFSEHPQFGSQTSKVIGGQEKIASGEWTEPFMFHDSWGAQFFEGFVPNEGEPVCSGKHGLDSFAPPCSLEAILRAHHIETVILAGLLANCCVDSTMRSAYERGYVVYTLTDCVASLDEAATKAAVEYNYPLFSKRVKSVDVGFDPEATETVSAISYAREHHHMLDLGLEGALALHFKFESSADSPRQIVEIDAIYLFIKLWTACSRPYRRRFLAYKIVGKYLTNLSDYHILYLSELNI